MKTYKIPYLVGNHPTSGWQAAIDINNHSDSKTDVNVIFYDHPSGIKKKEEIITLKAWESRLYTPDILLEKRQSIEIIGSDTLLITPIQFGNGGISNLQVFEVASKKD